MRRATMIRAFAAIVAVGVISVGPASAAQCSAGDTSVGGLLGTVGALVGGLLDGGADRASETSVCAEVEPTPTSTSTPNGSATPTPSDALPSPRASASQAPNPSVVPVAATSEPNPGPDAPIGDPTTAPPPLAPHRPSIVAEDPPVILGPTVPAASSAIPVGVAGSLISATATGLVAAILGRRRGRRAAYAHTCALLEMIDDAVLVIDARGVVTMGNGVAASMLGGPPEGRALRDVLEDAEGVARELATRATTAETSQTLSGAIRSTDGTIPVRLAVSPIGGRRRNGTVIAIRDLREQRRLERMKTEILSNVGHELRTPLTSALGFARLAATRDLSPERTRAFLAAVVESCERLERVIDLLIDVAAVEAGKTPAMADRVRITDLVRERVERWETRASSHLFSVRTTGRARTLAGNRALLAHALDEVIDNAVKFSPDGGLVTVHVTDAGEAVEIAVADQGIGIASEHLERLWDDFQQLDPSATRRFGGLGLGLAFVRRVVSTHGGLVDVTSEPGRGSTFRLRLPVREMRGTAHAEGSPTRTARPLAVTR